MSKAAREEFRDYGDGSFRAVQWWAIEDRNGEVESTHQAVTVFEWADVRAVQAWGHPSPNPVAPEGAKCMIYWCGRWTVLLASYREVVTAYAAYRKSNLRRILSLN